MPTKVCIVKAIIFPVVMYKCESSTIKKAECWRIDAFKLEKTLESSLDSKEIKPVNPKGHQPWLFTGKTDAEAEAPILCPPDVKSQLIRKDPDAEKDWRQEEKGTTEDEMVEWHHWVSEHEFEQTSGKWRAGKPGVLQSTGSQRVGHYQELNNNNYYYSSNACIVIFPNLFSYWLLRFVSSVIALHQICL